MPSDVFGRKTLTFLESKGLLRDSSTFNLDGPKKQTQKIIYLLKDVTRQGHLRAVLARSNNPARPHYLLAEPCLTTHAHISWKKLLSFGKISRHSLVLPHMHMAHTRFEKKSNGLPSLVLHTCHIQKSDFSQLQTRCASLCAN